MSKLREAAQTALNQWDKVSGVFRMTAETEALRAALAQPEAEAEAEPVAWRVRWIDPEEGPGDWVPTRDPDFYRSRPTYEVHPLYAHPPRDEWREAASALDAAKPLIKWLNDNHNPHTTAIVTTTGVEILVGIIAEKTTEFVHD